jgi:small subunit ribosomal protein S17
MSNVKSIEERRGFNMDKKGQRKTLQGTVVSNKMDKTVVVRVERLTKHPRYNKTIKRAKKFKAHDEQNQCAIGDIVEIMETRPLSKDKRWRVTEIVRRAAG